MIFGRELPAGWVVTRLSDVCREITVGHVGPMADKYQASGVPFLRSQNILPFRLNLNDIKFIPEDFHAKLKKSALSPGDVAIVRTGYPGTACVIPASLKDANCADLVIARPGDKMDPWFLVAILNSAWGRSSVAGNLVGVAQQHFNVGAAKTMQIALPPMAVQRRITSILSAYDDLIENNARRIAILEEMARRIHEEWFLRFRFAGHESVRMVESKLGPVPEGWPIRSFGEIVTFQKGKKPRETFKEQVSGSVPMLLIDALRGGPLEYAKPDKLLSVIPTDTIMVMDGSGSSEVFVGHEGAIGSTLGRYRSADQSKAGPYWVFLFFLTRKDELRAKNIGAAIPHANKDYINSIQIAQAEPTVVERFEDAVSPMFALCRSLKAKNFNLRATRDLLLPKLISGELDVSALPEPEAAAA